ncbi:hypothetical protein FRZ61_39960 [Hypericibacter adhaerens]|uniref:Uncharacterized protein n=1 Tax=Hypericibacter adhaerens TaxID=2602016 RepID=A0A5J6N5A2_9PROT|nr:hypothetical protein FRZ61_39960 [Hypericibacter adhaerens]
MKSWTKGAWEWVASVSSIGQASMPRLKAPPPPSPSPIKGEGMESEGVAFSNPLPPCGGG